MNKKKIAIISTSTFAAAALLTAGAFATFSDTAVIKTDATAGTVDIDVTGLKLTNSNNINPGDHDIYLPSNPDDPRNTGTEHKLSFRVDNKGTKSIKTRHVLTVSIEDQALDPSMLMFTENGQEIPNSTKYIVTENGDVRAADYDAQKHGKALAIRYYIIENILDGVGEPLSADGLTGVAEVENAVQTTGADYCYDFGMSHLATNEYCSCKIDIELEVQAMQYRNTTGSDWAVLFNDKIVAGN